jgi:hypothetical protein
VNRQEFTYKDRDQFDATNRDGLLDRRGVLDKEMLMKVKMATIALAILTASVLAGCSTDRWIGVEPGEYVVVNRSGAAYTSALAEIQKAKIDRDKHLVSFTLIDESEMTVSFVPRDKAAWPPGCPANINATRMEVLDIEEDPLTIGSMTLNNPVLVRECPPDPMRVVLREDGAVGGSGGACAGLNPCIFFEPPPASALLTALPPSTPIPSSVASAPVSPSPAATHASAPALTLPAWPAADPDSLPPENLVLYSQGSELKSLPHRPAFERPEINPIHSQESQHFEMSMYVLTSGPVASPDGRYVVIKAPGQEPFPPAPPTWLVDVKSGRMRKLELKRRQAAGVGPVTWSPDGRCLTFVVEDTLYVYDVQADAEPVPIFTQPGLRRLFASWSPTGEWIAVASDANPQDTVSSEREYIYWLISPDGTVVRNLGQYPVAGYGGAPYNMDWSPDGRLFVTPSQCLMSSSEGLALCGDSTLFDPSDPTWWLPRAWVRSYLSRQFAEGERPSFYARRLSPGGRRIACGLYDDAARQSELYVYF